MYDESLKTINNSLDLSASSFYSRDVENPFCFTGTQNPPTVTCSRTTVPVPHKGDKRKSQLNSDDIVPGSDGDIPPRKMFFSEAAMSSYFSQMNLQTVAPSAFSLDCTQATSFTNPAEPVQVIQDVEFEDHDTEDDADPSTGEDDSSGLVISDDLKRHLDSYVTDGPVEQIIRDLIIPKPELALVLYNPNHISITYRDIPAQDSMTIEPPLKESTVASSSYEHSSLCSMETESIPWTSSSCETNAPSYDWGSAANTASWMQPPTTTSRSCFPVTSAPIAANIFSIPYSSGQPYTAAALRLPVYRYQQPNKDSRFPFTR